MIREEEISVHNTYVDAKFKISNMISSNKNNRSYDPELGDHSIVYCPGFWYLFLFNSKDFILQVET